MNKFILCLLVFSFLKANANPNRVYTCLHESGSLGLRFEQNLNGNNSLSISDYQYNMHIKNSELLKIIETKNQIIVQGISSNKPNATYAQIKLSKNNQTLQKDITKFKAILSVSQGQFLKNYSLACALFKMAAKE